MQQPFQPWGVRLRPYPTLQETPAPGSLQFDADGQTFYGDGSGSLHPKRCPDHNKGEVIQFHPDDNILAFKDSSKLKGRGIVINNTFNINGSGDPDRIADEIMKKITRVGRIGF